MSVKGAVGNISLVVKVSHIGKMDVGSISRIIAKSSWRSKFRNLDDKDVLELVIRPKLNVSYT